MKTPERILAAGYVLTIDYGTNWENLLAQDSVRFRTYGPARREADRVASESGNAEADDRDASDPYIGPTLNDMTTDVNFSLLAAEGELHQDRVAGLAPGPGAGRRRVRRSRSWPASRPPRRRSRW